MKKMCPPGYHQNGFAAAHTLGHKMYCYTLLVPMNQRAQISQKQDERNVHAIRLHISLCLQDY